MIKNKVIFVLLSLFVSSATLWATPEGDGYRHEYIYADLSFSTESPVLNPMFENNENALRRLRVKKNELLKSPGAYLGSVNIVAARPFSGIIHEELTSSRMESITSYLSSEFSIPLGLIHIEKGKADYHWKELAEHLKASDYSWKNEVIAIIRPNGKIDIPSSEPENDNRIAQLRALKDGAVWKVLSEKVFPIIDASSVRVIVEVLHPEFVRDTVWVYKRSEMPKKTYRSFAYKKLLLEVKTNVIAIPLINVGVDFPLGNHFSVGANIYYPWVPRNGVRKDCFQLAAFDVDARYWFTPAGKLKNKGKMVGHSVGIYFAAGLYDFENNWEGHQGDFINAGVDYKYAMPIASGLFRLEFELGIGYIHSIAQPYSVFAPGGKAYINEGIKNRIEWIGPTRAQVNFVWPIFIKR